MPELREYQIEGRDFMLKGLSRPRQEGWPSTGLFASIGAGKTAITIAALSQAFASGLVKNALVIAPPRVIYDTWPNELQTFAPNLKYKIIHRHKGLTFKTQIELQSMDSVHTLVDYAGRWDLVIVDESRNFACWTTKRMRALRKVLKKTCSRIILTGTPTPEHYGELHGQMYILDNGDELGKNVTIFRANYMERGGWMGRQWKFRKERETEIMDHVAKHVLRIDATGHPDFPQLIENNVWVPMPDEIKAEYNRLKRELALELEREDGTPASLMVGHAGALYGKLKQYACGQVYVGNEKEGTRQSVIVHSEKMKALREVLSELYGNPSIILYHCKHDRDRIVKELLEQKRKVGVIDGTTSAVASSKIIKDWNEGRLDNLVSHPKCMGEGLNLQFGGANMIFFAIPDSCNAYLQTRGRIHRPGNLAGIASIHRILMRETVEELQVARIDDKIKNQNTFLSALREHCRK